MGKRPVILGNYVIKMSSIMLFTILVLFVAGNVLASEVYAWDDCPKGMVNDPYPGDCPRYVDTDGNGICDHSEPAPEDRIEDGVEINEELSSSKTLQKNVNNETFPNENDISVDKLNTKLVGVAAITIPFICMLGYAAMRNRINKD